MTRALIDDYFGYNMFSDLFSKVVSIYSPWLVVINYTAALNLIIITAIIIKELGKIGSDLSNLSLRSLDLDAMLSLNTPSIKFSQGYSLKKFKEKAKIIPYIALRFLLFIFSFLILFNIIAIILSLNLDDRMIKMVYFGAILVLNSFVILLGLYVFIKPQIAIKNIIKNEKRKTINSLQRLYTYKKISVLHSMITEHNQYTDKTLEEVAFLDTMIADTKKLFPWPFNYRQGVTFLISALVPMSSILLSLISNILFT